MRNEELVKSSILEFEITYFFLRMELNIFKCRALLKKYEKALMYYSNLYNNAPQKVYILIALKKVWFE